MNENEILENTESIEVESTEILQEINSGAGQETYTEIVVNNTELVETLTYIRDDVRIILAFTIITFVTACLRGWRKNVVKGVR